MRFTRSKQAEKYLISMLFSICDVRIWALESQYFSVMSQSIFTKCLTFIFFITSNNKQVQKSANLLLQLLKKAKIRELIHILHICWFVSWRGTSENVQEFFQIVNLGISSVLSKNPISCFSFKKIPDQKGYHTNMFF